MYATLEAAILAETAKAQTAVVKAYDDMVEYCKAPTLVSGGMLEGVAKAQAMIGEGTKLWLAMSKYMEEERTEAAPAGSVEPRLHRRMAALAAQLVEDYEVRSTNPWHAAEAATRRSAKVAVYAVLREVYNEV